MSQIKDLREILLNAKKGRTLTAQELIDEMFLIQGIQGMLHYFKSMNALEHDHLSDLYDTTNCFTRKLRKRLVIV